MTKLWQFSYFAQNIDRGHTPEPPDWGSGGAIEYPRSMFKSKNDNNEKTRGPLVL